MGFVGKMSSGATTLARLRVSASIAALVVSAALMAGCEADPRLGPPSFDPRVVTREPPQIAVFLGADARGDEETADEFASPLYRAEWARRGLRPGTPPASRPEGSPAEPFTFVGGVLDAPGFGHHLYLAAPPPGLHTQRSPAVWRVDTDPAGRVIWAERVWQFGDETSVSTTVGGMAEQTGLVQTALQVFEPELVIRIASDATQESYDVVRIAKANLPLDTGPEGEIIAFYGTDRVGAVVDGRWSYGQRSGPWRASGRGWQGSIPHAHTGTADLEAAYLASLLHGS
jgi:hypothetical protein